MGWGGDGGIRVWEGIGERMEEPGVGGGDGGW